MEECVFFIVCFNSIHIYEVEVLKFLEYSIQSHALLLCYVHKCNYFKSHPLVNLQHIKNDRTNPLPATATTSKIIV